MERRRHKRIITSIGVELISDNISFAGIIENLSEEGIYMKTLPTKNAINFAPGKTVELKFQIPSGETLNLHCNVQWIYKTPPHGLTNSIGLEIINLPLKYKEFVKSKI